MNIDSTEKLETILEDVEVVVGPIPFSRDSLSVNSTFVESKILYIRHFFAISDSFNRLSSAYFYYMRTAMKDVRGRRFKDGRDFL